MPPAIDQQVTFVYVRDLSASQRFYEEVLGLSLALDQGSCRIYRVAAEAFIGLCTGQEPHPEGTILTLVSDDVDGWAEHLREQGVELETPPTLNPRFDIYHLFARDPDGHRIEIQRFESPEWPRASKTYTEP